MIAGPCAAESEAQVLATAKALLPLRPIFRAGLWKPRSSPSSFQGVGEQGLPWLQRVQHDYGLDVATEVATPEQVRLCLKAGVNHLWIGARTAANPIVVQQLADTLSQAIRQDGLHLKSVWVKNPMHEDVRLWHGNIERFEKSLQDADVQVMAVHRGCDHHPCWDMAHNLHTMMPYMPMLLDASHMAGIAERVPQLLSKGVELHYDGCMVEVHLNPKQALSDAQQQLTPEQLTDYLAQLSEQDGDTPLTLRWFRAMMDEVDDNLWQTIQQRMTISRRIGLYKRQEGIPVVQPTRFQTIRDARIKWAEQHHINPQTVADIYEALHKESIRHQ